MNLVEEITQYANGLGFGSIGFTKIESFDEPYALYLSWIKEGYHGEMAYLERYAQQRKTPQALAQWSKTALVVLVPYLQKTLLPKSTLQIAKFAYNTDYHIVIKQKLHALLSYIQSKIVTRGRCVVDTAPLLERSLAVKAGLGWIGKSGMLIHHLWGTYTLIGTILLEAEIETPSTLHKSSCGNCNLCVSSCPNNAILDSGLINARKCISYLTIEYPRYNPGVSLSVKGNYVYGCDVCQDVCPHNHKVVGIDRVDFTINREIIWQRLSDISHRNS